MKKIFYLILVISCISCQDERSKKQHYKTIEICNKIYIETYVVFSSGAYGSDVHADYITDSLHFRLFIGTEDTGNEILFTQCKGDSLIVKKSTVNKENDSVKVNFVKIFSKKDLIKEGNFD